MSALAPMIIVTGTGTAVGKTVTTAASSWGFAPRACGWWSSSRPRPGCCQASPQTSSVTGAPLPGRVPADAGRMTPATFQASAADWISIT